MFLGFLNEMEAAVKFEVGVATIRIWVDQGMLPGILIGDRIYVPANAEKPTMTITVNYNK